MIGTFHCFGVVILNTGFNVVFRLLAPAANHAWHSPALSGAAGCVRAGVARPRGKLKVWRRDRPLIRKLLGTGDRRKPWTPRRCPADLGSGMWVLVLISVSDGLGEELHEVLAVTVTEVADLGATGEAVSEDFAIRLGVEFA